MFRLQHKVSAAVFPWYSELIEKVNRNAQLMAWFRRHRDVPKLPDRESYFREIERQYIANQAIDYFEFGVYQGDSIRRWLALNTNPASRFFGFDSFEGLPEKWSRGCDKGAFDVAGKMPQIDDMRVQFFKGWFQHSLPPFLENYQPGNRLVIHCDADIYSSTLFVLTAMNSLIKPGTIILFDEFASALHEFRAWLDYQSSYMREGKPIMMTSDVHVRVAFLVP